MSQKRSDYAPSSYSCSAKIEHIKKDSPAERAGLEAGMTLYSVNGEPLRDMIDWQWLTDGPSIFLEGFSGDFEFEVELERDFGESWGIDFSDMVFDGIKTCKNACVFCFMSMLPEDMRGSLYIKDDDFRLSFLQGNFVTFTNISADELNRIIEQHISPLNMSLHAIDSDVRRRLIGKFESRGIEVLEELLDNSIEIHAQIVLCPGLNDGKVLKETLEYVLQKPLITSLGIVPLGFTKFQKRFSSSYSTKEKAEKVTNLVESYQKKAQEKYGKTRFYMSDEFYLWADQTPPDASFYDGYPQYYDGIGMLRSFIDDVDILVKDKQSLLYKCFEYASDMNKVISFVSGQSFAPVLQKYLSPYGLKTFEIKNNFFGGNVDVAGLLVESDILAQLPNDLSDYIICLPEPMFNFDGLTLEGMHQKELISAIETRGAKAIILSSEIIDAFSELNAFFKSELSTDNL